MYVHVAEILGNYLAWHIVGMGIIAVGGANNRLLELVQEAQQIFLISREFRKHTWRRIQSRQIEDPHIV